MDQLQTAKAAARAGGDIVARYFREGIAIRTKQNDADEPHAKSYNLITDADLEAEYAIVKVIRQAFPDHAVLGEESHDADPDAAHLWVVDPIDGTNNFAHRLPHFAVSIAYYQQGKAVCGVVFNPIRDDWYEAVRGQGAFHNGREVNVGEQSRLDEVLVGVGFYYDRGRMMEATLDAIRDLFRQNIHGIRRFGTASLDLAHVGIGAYGGYFEYELSAWDFAAGRLFVEEAGGRVTTCQGAELPLGRTSVLASNGLLHDRLLEIVACHEPDQPLPKPG
jgi:myo-inositol-1(or 4)-monophosphatase